MKNEIEINDENFEKEVIVRYKEMPVVIDFWAPWSMPCKELGPVMEKFADEYNGKFILAKINVNEYSKTAEKYHIMSIPCIKMFKDRALADEFVGRLPESKIKEWLDRNIGK